MMPAARERLREERGASLVLFTFLLLGLIGMAAFMVDLGWLYWQGLETQHGADAAALGGVVYEPTDQASAYATAREVASAVNASITTIDWRDDPQFDYVDNDNQLYVHVSRQVGTFFMRVFGVTSVTINREAVAQYVLPLKLGSPQSQFGNSPG